MEVRIDETWRIALQDEFSKEYFKSLVTFVRKSYQTKICYPPPRLIFNAFDRTPFDRVKVVILGQDPYHGKGQAHGLSFSVPPGVKIPASLQNIYKEIESEYGRKSPSSGDLTRWADQGVLLLNSILTVEDSLPGAHQGKGWEEFTSEVVRKISTEKENIVFLLWGSYAQKKAFFIDEKKHFVLTSVHPSPLSAYRGFLGCNHFKEANNYLKKIGEKEIEW